jgi:hypothetical protein
MRNWLLGELHPPVGGYFAAAKRGLTINTLQLYLNSSLAERRTDTQSLKPASKMPENFLS